MALPRALAKLAVGLVSSMALHLAHASVAGSVIFTVGQAHIENRAVELGQPVNEGELLRTGAGGYIYIKTVDNGFLILRPSSQARVIAYHVDKAQAANSRFKIELIEGVARNISGDAVKQSRENFRFNTPVGAIGVRGTDFTVYTNQQTSRIAITSGGVVASGFGGNCQPQGSGPCEGSQARELFANQSGQLLQINQGQLTPLVLRDAVQSPDQKTPPRADEPAGKPAIPGANLSPLKDAGINQLALVSGQAVANPVPSPVVWGRWQAVLDQSPEIDVGKKQQTHDLLAMAGNYVILREQGTVWQPPLQSAVSFTLQQYQAVVLDEMTNIATSASLQNAALNVNFAKSSFSTRFDLVTPGERFLRQAQGGVSRDGQLAGDSQFSHPTNMAVSGVLSNGAALGAAYVFQTRVDDRRVATGVTNWAK